MTNLSTKTCSTCKQAKPTTDFYRDKQRKDGLHGQCKTCYNRRIKNWRKANPDKRAAYKKKWRAENPEKVNAMQRRAERNNIDQLTDGYVRKRIVQGLEGVSQKDVPDILVQLKRKELITDRIIKIKKDENNQ